MKAVLPLLICAFLSACSDSTPVTTATVQPVGSTTGNDSSPVAPDVQMQNDPTNQLNAGNYEQVLTESLSLLRFDFQEILVPALESIASQWEANEQAITGLQEHTCPDGGVVTRNVTAVTPMSVMSQLNIALQSELTFDSCSVNELALNGVVGLNWERSSPAQLGGGFQRNVYSFNQLAIQSPGTLRSLTGTHDRNIVISGPSDSYTLQTSIDFFQETVNNVLARSLSNSNYTENYSHAIATPTGTEHQFSEQGSGFVVLTTPSPLSAELRLEPALSYNVMRDGDTATHNENLDSGELTLQSTGNAGLAMTSATGDVSSVRYTLTDPSGELTEIEREWIAPAQCRPDPGFNYDSC